MKKVTFIVMIIITITSCVETNNQRAIKLAKAHTGLMFNEDAATISKQLTGFQGVERWRYFKGEDSEGNIFNVVENRILTSDKDTVVIQYKVNLSTGLTERGRIEINRTGISEKDFYLYLIESYAR